MALSLLGSVVSVAGWFLGTLWLTFKFLFVLALYASSVVFVIALVKTLIRRNRILINRFILRSQQLSVRIRHYTKHYAYLGLQYSIVLTYVLWTHFSLLLEYSIRCIKPPKPIMRSEEMKVRCAICLDDLPQRDMVCTHCTSSAAATAAPCTHPHQLCKTCLYDLTVSAVVDDPLPHLPQCPQCPSPSTPLHPQATDNALPPPNPTPTIPLIPQPTLLHLLATLPYAPSSLSSLRGFYQEKARRTTLTTRITNMFVNLAYSTSNRGDGDGKIGFIRCPTCSVHDYDVVYWHPIAALTRSAEPIIAIPTMLSTSNANTPGSTLSHRGSESMDGCSVGGVGGEAGGAGKKKNGGKWWKRILPPALLGGAAQDVNVTTEEVTSDPAAHIAEDSASNKSGVGEAYERAPIFCPLCVPTSASPSSANTTNTATATITTATSSSSTTMIASPFCSHCLAPYHYRSSCDYYAAQERGWREWRGGQGGQEGVLDLLVMQGVMTKAEVDRERDKLKDLLSVQRMTLLLDEEYKMANCRHCPRCNRLVEHMGGCDLMRCGQDYHALAGVARMGCGEHFRWSFARPYVPAREPKASDEHKPDSSRTWVDWWWGEGWKEEMERKKKVKMYSQTHSLSADLAIHLCCDACKKEIKGPLLRCLNCPAVDLCLVCGIRGEVGVQGGAGGGERGDWAWTGLSSELLWGNDKTKRKKAKKVSAKPDGYIPKHLPSHVCLVILPKMH